MADFKMTTAGYIPVTVIPHADGEWGLRKDLSLHTSLRKK